MTTNNQQPILIRTPKIKPDESFRGYFLRLAETNGYRSQAWIFALANIDRGYPNPTLESTVKLEKLLGSSTNHLRHSCNRRGDGSNLFIMGLQFHKSVFRKTSTICPDCIRDFGYIPAFTDLMPIRCCPVHRKSLIDTCPACTNSISWFRPGLLTCTCGAALSHQYGTATPPSRKEIADAARFVKALYWGASARTFNSSDPLTGFSHIRLIAAITSNRSFANSAKSLRP